MTEREALDRIASECQTGDLEANGCNLDDIVSDFLRANGFSALADAVEKVECWRA